MSAAAVVAEKVNTTTVNVKQKKPVCTICKDLGDATKSSGVTCSACRGLMCEKCITPCGMCRVYVHEDCHDMHTCIYHNECQSCDFNRETADGNLYKCMKCLNIICSKCICSDSDCDSCSGCRCKACCNASRIGKQF